jgi:hypothetical protein
MESKEFLDLCNRYSIIRQGLYQIRDHDSHVLREHHEEIEEIREGIQSCARGLINEIILDLDTVEELTGGETFR